MKLILFVVAIALAVLSHQQYRDLETATFNLARAREQIDRLQRALQQRRPSQPEFAYRDSARPGAATDAVPPPLGQWMWEKRDNPLASPTDSPERGSRLGRRGPR